MAYVRTRLIQPKTSFNLLFNHSHLPNNLRILNMSMTQGKSKRPICPSCSKPTRTCLCSRILTPAIDNSVNVTILQHALESNHPLNSTRIARLGFKNLTLATISDVNFQARFIIRLFENSGRVESGLFSHKSCEIGETQKLFPDKDSNLIDCVGKDSGLKNGDGNGDIPGSSISDGLVVNNQVEKKLIYSKLDSDGGVCEEHEGCAITVSIGKYGAISYLSHIWMPQSQSQSQKLSFDKILTYHEACEALSKGFLVKKLQMRQLDKGINLEEYEEFELEVPSGSVLLFPSEKAVNVNDLEAIGYEVKNLIVLDGTWAKAKRVYSENPWLNILPHLKLEVTEMSLYSDVRQQPKAGYLSTIESIVYALKALGDKNHEGLDNLLDTFESMVGDQRRCKDERLSKVT
ncbi:hypothetical protein Lalb_Chr04g0248491 [Lupinus albus]|uniref:tRNA-uridine aminocarboxypropyltransferase n=1 Tax=Lupinus albus TaxID=3870 RepID=A0A6A4QMH1_LUPAL|nr:hypothetical protein Lalb_Chr04g0248491 [Lupinus albus]